MHRDAGRQLFSETGEEPGPLPRFEPAAYACRPDRTCEDIKCSAHGTCKVDDGVPACLCDPGFAGVDCSECAVGYERLTDGGGCTLGPTCSQELCNGHGDCILNAFGDIVCECELFDGGCVGPAIVVKGPETSIEQGASVTLKGAGGEGVYHWRITEGPGTLRGEGGPSPTIIYEADFSAPGVTFVRVEAVDTGGVGGIVIDITLPDSVPITGQVRAELVAFDDAMLAYMKGRGIRAGVLALAKDGQLIYSRGYGYMDKGTDADPFDHGGESGPAVPPRALMRLASVTKPFTAAAVRDGMGGQTNDAALPYIDGSLGDPLVSQAEGVLPYTIDGAPPFVTDPVVNQGDLQCPSYPNNLPDSRWQQITVQDLLEHRGGFNRRVHPDDRWKEDTDGEGGFEPPGWNKDRSYGATWADPNFKPTMMIHDLEEAIDGQFASRGPLWVKQIVQYMAGICLYYAPGGGAAVPFADRYSNFGYTLLGRVLEGIHGVKWEPSGGGAGEPPPGWGPYVGLVQDFLADYGVTDVHPGGQRVYSSSGLGGGQDPREPYYRHLADDGADIGSSSSGTSLFNVVDEFGLSESLGQMVFDSNTYLPVVDAGFSMAVMEAHGGLVASAPEVIRFMRHFMLATASYDTMGAPRTSTNVGNASHSGALPGTYTLAWQMPSGAVQAVIPAPTGVWNQDSATCAAATTTNTCALTSGIDVVVLFNQWEDPRTRACGNVYGTIGSFLVDAACKVVDWPDTPLQFIQLAP